MGELVPSNKQRFVAMQVFTWVREAVGWALFIVGLCFFYLSYGYVDSRQVIEGSICAFVGVFVFRAGIGFLKMATAARILSQIRADK